MDVTYPKTLSTQIDAQHADLENALLQNHDGVLLSINSGLKLLKQQFRATVGIQLDPAGSDESSRQDVLIRYNFFSMLLMPNWVFQWHYTKKRFFDSGEFPLF